MDRLSKLERDLIKVQKSAKTLFPAFNRPHNWLRMKSRTYYSWHMQPIAGLSHYLTLGVYVFVVLALIASIFTYDILTNSAKALATNIWTYDNSSDFTYDSSKIEVTGGVAQLKNGSSYVAGTDWIATESSTNWSYRKPLTVDNSANGSALTNYQVKFTLDTSALISASKLQSDCDDLRFTSSNGATAVDYFIESGCNTTTTKVWVEVPSVGANSTTTLYMYYGNTAASAGTSLANTFTLPSGVSNLKLWLKADAGVTLNGSTVSSWADQSGNSNTASQSTANNQPTYVASGINSQPVIRFDGSNDSMSISNFALSSASFLWVYQTSNVSTGDGRLFSSLGSCGSSPSVRMSSGSLQYWGNWGTLASGYANNTPSVTSFLKNGNNFSSYKDGSSQQTFSDSRTYSGTFELGGNYCTFGAYHAMDMAEFIVFSTNISTADRAKLERYLAAKYGITVTAEYSVSVSQGSEATYLSFPTDYPTIVNNTAHGYLTLPGFAELAASGSSGTIKYQLSPDGGTTWYWYNSGWTTTTNATGSSGYANANTASDINTNIATFTASGTISAGQPKQFKWRAFFASNGQQQPKLDTLALAFNTSWDLTSGTSTRSDTGTLEYSSGIAQLTDLGGGTYSTSNPYVTLSTGQVYSSISTFSPTLGSGSTGTIKYQLSPNDGTTWYYHNGSTWTAATPGTYAHTNTETEVNQYIATFNDISVAGTKTLKWRAYFNSNGTTRPKLDSVAINYYTPPTAPTSGAAASITTSSITWTWTDNSSTEAEFKVINAANSATITTVSSTTTGTTGTVYTYQETGLNINTQYSRIIKATDGTEDGTGITITAYTLANAPATPALTAADTSVTVVLDVNSNPSNTQFAFGLDTDANGTIDTNGYVQTDGSLGSSAAWQTYATWGGAAGTSVTGLTANTTYRFMAKARNGDTTETAFSSRASTLTLASVPAAPTVTPVTSTSLKVVINENSNPSTVEYAIWNDTSAKYIQSTGALGDSAVWRTKADWGGASGVTNTGLTENTTYTYKIKARNSASTETALGTGTSRATPIAPTPPASVTIKDTSDINKVNNFELSVQWDAVSIASLDYYILERSTDANTYSQVTTTTSRFYRDTNLTAGTYYYRVKSHTDLPDVSDPSDVVSATVGPDSVAPVVSSVTATVVNDTKAVITWVTDETATSTVEYGASESYGNQTADTTLTSATKRRHTVTLTGLTPSTTYHFRVKSSDTSGNESTSTDYTFATTDSPVDTSLVTATISEVTQSSNESDQVSSSAKIVWATAEPGDSFVEIGPTTSYGSVFGRFETVSLHTVVVTGLQPNTTYNYRVRSTNARGQTTVSANQTLVTGSVAKPTITDVQVTDTDLTSAVISWRTPDKPATTKVQWGTNEDMLDQSSTEDLSLDTNHRVALSDLKSGTKYYFRVTSRDTENVATYQSVLFSFETLAAPNIATYKVDSVSDKDATILVTTNTDTDVVLSYSTQSDLTNAKQQTTGQFVKTHTLRLSDLQPDTTYSARLQARDKYGNATTSGIFSITTARDNYAPEFVKITTEVNAVGLGDNAQAQAIIAVTLNEPAKDMTVRYGVGIAPTGNEQTLSIQPGSNYGVIILKNLRLSTGYHIRTDVTDDAGNVTIGEWKTITTPQSQASILNIILKQLTDTLGIFNFGAR